MLMQHVSVDAVDQLQNFNVLPTRQHGIKQKWCRLPGGVVNMQKNHAEHLTRKSIKAVIRATRGPVLMLHPENPTIILMYFLPGRDVVS